MMDKQLASLTMQVFLGARTSMIIDNEARSSAGYTVGNTGFGDERGVRQAEHFVVEVEEPSTGKWKGWKHHIVGSYIGIGSKFGADVPAFGFSSSSVFSKLI